MSPVQRRIRFAVLLSGRGLNKCHLFNDESESRCCLVGGASLLPAPIRLLVRKENKCHLFKDESDSRCCLVGGASLEPPPIRLLVRKEDNCHLFNDESESRCCLVGVASLLPPPISSGLSLTWSCGRGLSPYLAWMDAIIRIFIVDDKAIQNCINLKITSLYISMNTFPAISTFLLYHWQCMNYSFLYINNV